MPNSMIAAWRTERPWLADTIVCDGLLPWANDFLPPGAKLADQLRRFHANGVDHISLTAAAGREGTVEALGRLGLLRRELSTQADWISVASDDVGIENAKRNGRLSVSFHFQSATPFADDLDLVDASFGAQGLRSRGDERLARRQLSAVGEPVTCAMHAPRSSEPNNLP